MLVGVRPGKKSLLDGISAQLKNGRYLPSIHSNGRQNKKVIMGIMHSTRPHYGVQFHPESIATCHGSKIFRNFRDITEDYWLRSRSSYIMERNAHYTGKQELLQVLSLHCCSC
ncbi:hypothetical protein Pint_06063 [Pistacia integerrima]|uniref:Uncharacterized protein n=1 Tax=Pistacia integerrima TaxID=434235 RepID=A0ACC0Z562_9ROSI|nr:hypothetical protein Pint_06063 [Pistacia integerrima]